MAIFLYIIYLYLLFVACA